MPDFRPTPGPSPDVTVTFDIAARMKTPAMAMATAGHPAGWYHLSVLLTDLSSDKESVFIVPDHRCQPAWPWVPWRTRREGGKVPLLPLTIAASPAGSRYCHPILDLVLIHPLGHRPDRCSCQFRRAVFNMGSDLGGLRADVVQNVCPGG